MADGSDPASGDAASAPAGYEKRVVLENAPRPFGSCIPMATSAAALQQRGEDVAYTNLMGASSQAFRLQFSWCPSAPHACTGFNTFEPALRALGYEQSRLDGSFHSEDGKPARESTEAGRRRTRHAVQAAMDAGESVIFGSDEDALLVRYEPVSTHNATGWLRRQPEL